MPEQLRRTELADAEHSGQQLPDAVIAEPCRLARPLDAVPQLVAILQSVILEG
jgi:hypothetical protein